MAGDHRRDACVTFEHSFHGKNGGWLIVGLINLLVRGLFVEEVVMLIKLFDELTTHCGHSTHQRFRDVNTAAQTKNHPVQSCLPIKERLRNGCRIS